MDKLTPEQLLDRYLSGQCTEEEKATLESWYLLQTENAADQLPEPDYNHLEHSMWKAISHAVPEKRPVRLWPRIAAAAAILLVAFAMFFYVKNQQNSSLEMASANIHSGSNKAYLLLANGKKLALTDAANGKLADEAGVEITKTADGKLVYTVKSNRPSSTSLTNTITTPRGGQWEVRLPDGSSVWLNSSSALTYPTDFKMREQREVELKGEAYFEVRKDHKHPFIVKTEQQVVRVLGTHFNINAYPEEKRVKTTLLEGAVQVSGRAGVRTLKPGQQSDLSSVHIEVKTVQVDDAVAWKNGYFMFNYESLDMVMRKIARWYDVEFQYDDPAVKNEIFFGSISKYENIAKVLKMLELTDVVKFRIEHKVIRISKK